MPAPTPDVVPQGWDQAAQLYEEIITPFTSLYADELAGLLGVRPGDRVLDVAAGPGAFALSAARRGASSVLATDFAPVMIERLRERARAAGVRSVDARVMDGQALDVADGSFDVAASVFGVMFFPDRAKGLRELRRAVKPGGRVGLATWSAPARAPVISVFSSAIRAALPERPAPSAPPAVFSMADPKRVEEEMLVAGFRDVRVRTITHDWRFADRGILWERFAPGSPVFAAILHSLDEPQRARVRAALDEIVRRDHERSDGSVVLAGEAHLVTARR